MSREYKKACGAQWFTCRLGPPQPVGMLSHSSGVGYFHPIGTPSHSLVYELENANVYVDYICGCSTRPSKGVLPDGSFSHVYLEDLIFLIGNINKYSFLDENALIKSKVSKIRDRVQSI